MSQAPPQQRNILSIPPSIKRLFDKFPLITYAVNELPQRSVAVPTRSARADIHAFYDAHVTRRKSSVSVKDDALHAFFSWASPEDTSPNVASFNPGCLMWQAYLVFQGIKFHIVPSNNHASFPHALPLIASHPDAGPPFVQPVISSDGLWKWARKSSEIGMQQDAYMSLLDGPIRRAWLYSMYLTPNFEKITIPCYISTASSSSIIQYFSARELREAAKSELLKHKLIIDPRALFAEAEEAFLALDTLSKKSRDGKSESKPTSLLDAALFAYTYLLLEMEEDYWEDRSLRDMVSRCEGLRWHMDVVRKGYFRARPPAVWRRSKLLHS